MSITIGDQLLRAVCLDPGDLGAQAAYTDWLIDQDRHAEANVLSHGHLVLVALDVLAAWFLTQCRFVPATWDKRFVREVVCPVDREEITALTVKQYASLWRHVRRHRRQIYALEPGYPRTSARRAVVLRAAWLTGKEPTP